MKQQITENKLAELIAEELMNEGQLMNFLNKASGANQVGAFLQNAGDRISTGLNNIGNKITTGTRETAQKGAEALVRKYITLAIQTVSTMIQAAPNNGHYKNVVAFLKNANKSLNASIQANTNQQTTAANQRAAATNATKTANAQRMAAAKQQTAQARQNYNDYTTQRNAALNKNLTA